MLRIFVILSFFIVFFYVNVSACWEDDAVIRSVKIKIIDKSTGTPLEGIPVYYALRTYWPDKVFIVLRNPEGTNTKIFRVIDEYVSDSNGEVNIPAQKIGLRRWKSEKLYDENIYINIETQVYTPKGEYKYIELGVVLHEGKKEFINPMTAYRGFKIRSTTWEMDPKDYGGTKFEIADALWNGMGLLKKEPETFVIELERWDSDENINKE